MPDPKLPEPYDGQPVIKTTVKITRAGDGLSEALATDQQTLHLGEKVTVVLETEVVGVNIKPLDKETPSGPLVAQYVLAATDRATIADGEDIEAMLVEQQKRNEQAKGIHQLPMDDDVPRDAAGFPLDKIDNLTNPAVADQDWEDPPPEIDDDDADLSDEDFTESSA